MKLTVKGELLSKSNSRIFRNFGGRPLLIKSPKAQQYIEEALWQIKSQMGNHKMFEDPVKMDITVWYKTKRPDLDVSLIQDILEKAGVYKNDRLVHEIVARKRFDKDDPRLTVEVSLLEST